MLFGPFDWTISMLTFQMKLSDAQFGSQLKLLEWRDFEILYSIDRLWIVQDLNIINFFNSKTY